MMMPLARMAPGHDIDGLRASPVFKSAFVIACNVKGRTLSQGPVDAARYFDVSPGGKDNLLVSNSGFDEAAFFAGLQVPVNHVAGMAACLFRAKDKLSILLGFRQCPEIKGH